MQNTPRDTAGLIRVRTLSRAQPTSFALVPEAEERRALARDLGLLELRKLRFAGRLEPSGKADWRLVGDLGATVVQACVVTLEPVTTRIEESLERMFLADPPPVPEGEAEMPEDERVEALTETVDLRAILREALALAIPHYPRADGAALEETEFAEPGVAPMTDEDAKPFAGLSGLRDRLGGSDGTED